MKNYNHPYNSQIFYSKDIITELLDLNAYDGFGYVTYEDVQKFHKENEMTIKKDRDRKLNRIF
jgi:hypothetical protein